MSDPTEYARRACAHAPRTIEELRAAILRMLEEGHGDFTIASALRLNVEAVRRLVGCGSCE